MKNFTNIDRLYVAHIGCEIVCIGTQEQCQAHKDSQPYDASWTVSDLESYGDHCHSAGYDSGYDQGCFECCN